MLLRLVAHLKSEFDLTTAQYETLLSLEEAGGSLTAAQLSQLLLYSSGSTTHLVARLEQRGLLTRSRGTEDGRVVTIALTPEGELLIDRATTAHVADIEASFSPLIPDDEIEALLRFTRRLSAAEGLSSQPGPPA
jgi:DNA-binding MarR family transcriptional regulator